MPVVRSDQHGLLIKTGGYVFRPDFPIGYDHAFPNETGELQPGDKVKGQHRGGPLLNFRYTDENGDQKKLTWFNHGDYLRPTGTPDCPTEKCYRPEHERWRK